MSAAEQPLSVRLRRGAITEDPVGERRARAELERRLFGDHPPPIVVADRYVIGELLGSGGSGAVYAAHDRQLERAVAVKLLRAPRDLDDRVRERVAREARVLAKLSHPNVVAVYDLGTSGEQLYVAMELVAGCDLCRWLHRSRRSPAQILAVLRSAGTGLAAAHEQGIVHRDFKPSNVVVGDDGSVKVVDFGLATIGADATHHGEVVGTPRYMSPEQHAGRELDARSDIYSFCATLYEALYGELPWQTETQKRSASIRPRRQRGVPVRVRALLRAGLDPNPDVRPAHMRVVVDRLRPPSRARVWAAISVASTLAITAAIAASHDDAPCALVDAAATQAWHPEIAESVERSLAGPGEPHRVQAAAHVRQRLDAWIEAWSQQRIAACEATHVERSQSEALLDRAMACLDVRLSEFRSLTTLLADPDATFGGRELEAMDELTPPSECSTARMLARGVDAGELDEDAVRVETEIAALSVQLDVGVVDGVERALDELFPRVVSDPTRHAKALLVRARLERERGLVDAHVATLEEAVVVAHKGSDRLDRATAWTRLARAHAELLDDAGRGEHDLALADAALIGIDGALAERLQIALATSGLLRKASRETEARPHAEEALSLAEQTGDASLLAAAHHERASVLTGLERFDDATREFETTLSIRRSQGGERNPAVAVLLSDLGLLAVKQNRHDEAHARMSEALEIAERNLPERHPLLAELRENLALVEIGMHRPERARELLVRAIEIERLAFGSRSSKLAGALLLLAEVEADLGARDAEATLLRQALEIYEGMERPPRRALVTVKFHLARSLAIEARELAIAVDAPPRIREAIDAWLATAP
jgi:eukaryotic-like serine/threonine-protein kinase